MLAFFNKKFFFIDFLDVDHKNDIPLQALAQTIQQTTHTIR